MVGFSTTSQRDFADDIRRMEVQKQGDGAEIWIRIHLKKWK